MRCRAGGGKEGCINAIHILCQVLSYPWSGSVLANAPGGKC